MESEARIDNVVLTVTPHEKRVLASLAKGAGLSVSNYLRMLISKELKARGEPEFRENYYRKKPH